MTTFTWPSVEPQFSSWALSSNTSVFESVFTRAIQTLDRGGERWEAQLRLVNQKGDNKAALKALYAKLNGQQHRVSVHDHSHVQRGAFGGTPLVQGAAQTGNTLLIDGLTLSVANWIREGDYFSVNNELKMATADLSSDGSGELTLSFIPRLRSAPANNAAITTTNPTGVFLMASNRSSWSNKPGDFADFVFSLIEDIAA